MASATSKTKGSVADIRPILEGLPVLASIVSLYQAGSVFDRKFEQQKING
jgi:hypothetical protein